MLIVVEGVDGSGKTTLIENLRHQTKQFFLVLRTSGPPRSSEDLEESLRLISQLRISDVPVILDRHPLISDPIYGPTLRGVNLVEEVYGPCRRLEILKVTVDRIIYCRPPLAVALTEVDKQRQLPGVREQLPVLYDLYDKAMEDLDTKGLPVVTYDWVNHKSSSVSELFFKGISWGC